MGRCRPVETLQTLLNSLRLISKHFRTLPRDSSSCRHQLVVPHYVDTSGAYDARSSVTRIRGPLPGTLRESHRQESRRRAGPARQGRVRTSLQRSAPASPAIAAKSIQFRDSSVSEHLYTVTVRAHPTRNKNSWQPQIFPSSRAGPWLKLLRRALVLPGPAERVVRLGELLKLLRGARALVAVRVPRAGLWKVQR